MTDFDWHNFSFAQPGLLWLLLIVPALALLRSARGAAPAIFYSSIAPFRALGHARRSRAGGWLLGLFLAALSLFIAALARPQQSNVTSRIEASGVDIVLALDVSRSMLAEDLTIGHERANRIDAVKKVTEDFINGRPSDRIGIVAFAGRPYMVSPLTLDHDWLLKNLQRVRIGLVEDGTAIGLALASSANRLKDRKESKSRIIVLLTDGINNTGKIEPITAAEAAHTMGLKIYTIGVGSQGMAPIPVPNGFGGTVYQQIPVEVDEAGLKQIAKIGEGEFFRATDEKSLQSIFERIDKLEKSTVEMSKLTNYRDLFPWFVDAGLALLALWMIGRWFVWRSLP
jgi:Ca-activated chloride channel homolog